MQESEVGQPPPACPGNRALDILWWRNAVALCPPWAIKIVGSVAIGWVKSGVERSENRKKEMFWTGFSDFEAFISTEKGSFIGPIYF